MAFAAKKWLVNLRNINKYNKLSYTGVTFSSWNRPNNVARIPKQLNPRLFHTTNTVYKIVAFKLSDIGEGIREVVVKEWFVKVGDKVQQFDNICEVQSDKAAVTITSRYDGVITKLYHAIDQIAHVGQPLVDIEVNDSKDNDIPLSSSTPETSKDEQKADALNIQKVKVLTTPAVRRIAAQFQVDLSSVNATGKNGRVLKEDVLDHLNMNSDKSNEIPKVLSVEAVSIPLAVATATTGVVTEDKIVPVTGFMKAMVKSMTEAMKIPHFVFSDEYDVTKLVNSREGLRELAQKRGVKLTYMPIIIKAASQCLTLYPVLNSSLDTTCENLIYKASHNIGVAMDTPNGLIVPVIKNVQNKSIFEIALELNSLKQKGLNGQLGLNELSGGTFTISNIGIIGGTYTKPVIFPPQVSIGALGKIQILPRFNSEGNLVKAHILSVSWSADHRVIDGVTMARFSNQLKEYLEDPQKLILDL